MVHWDRTTTSVTSRHHKLQLPLLLEMVQNQSQNQLGTKDQAVGPLSRARSATSSTIAFYCAYLA